MYLKRILTLTIAVLLIAGIVVSCGSNDTSTTAKATAESTNNSGTTVSTSNQGTEGEEAALKPVITDFNYEYKMLTSTNGSASSLEFYFSSEGKMTGDVISNALYTREVVMRDLYNVRMKTNVITDVDEYQNLISNTAASEDYAFDVSMIPARYTMPLVIAGVYQNILKYEDSLNLSASYWDQRIQNSYKINNMLFTLEGDYTIYDEMTTLVVVYNQTVYNNYQMVDKYGTPYQMVANDNWTYAAMMEMIKDLSSDSYNDGSMDERDTWGMVSELTAPYYFFLGSGLNPINNHSAEMSLQLKDATAYQVIYNTLEDTMKMLDSKDILMANKKGAITASDYWTAASDVFSQDRALFRTTTLSAVTRLREMVSDYGILPIPLYSEEQDGYHCWVSGNTHCPLAVSRYTPDASITLQITEIMTYHSRYGTDSLYSGFFDHLAHARLGRSNDDIKMLEVIFASKTFDIDQVFKITNLEPRLYTLANNNRQGELSSTLATITSEAEANLADFIIKVTANN